MTHPTTGPEDPAVVPWATTRESPYAVGAGAAPDSPAPAGSPPAPHSAPALNPPTWSGRKTAIAAALAIGISSMGAIGAAAALPSGSDQGGQGQFQRGGPGGGFPGGIPQGTQQGTQQGPGTLQQPPGARLQQAPADPNASTT